MFWNCSAFDVTCLEHFQAEIFLFNTFCLFLVYEPTIRQNCNDVWSRLTSLPPTISGPEVFILNIIVLFTHSDYRMINQLPQPFTWGIRESCFLVVVTAPLWWWMLVRQLFISFLKRWNRVCCLEFLQRFYYIFEFWSKFFIKLICKFFILC